MFNRSYFFGLLSGLFLGLLGSCFFYGFFFSPTQRLPEPMVCFLRHRAVFEEYIKDLQSDKIDPRKDGTFPPTNDLRKCRIVAIWIENDFVFFEYNPRWIDERTKLIIYDKLARGNVVTALLRLYPRKYTYRIHEVEAHWIYWEQG